MLKTPHERTRRKPEIPPAAAFAPYRRAPVFVLAVAVNWQKSAAGQAFPMMKNAPFWPNYRPVWKA